MNRMPISALVFGLTAITATPARAGGGTGAGGGEEGAWGQGAGRRGTMLFEVVLSVLAL